MRTRNKELAEAPARGPGAVRKGGVRKGGRQKKAAGAVVSKRIVLRSRSGASGSRAARTSKSKPDAADPADASSSEGEGEEGQQQQQQEQHSGGIEPSAQPQQQAAARQRQVPARKRRSVAAVQRPDEQRLESLSTEALQEIFLHISKQEQQGYCREILPLVCKRFRDVLLEPSSVWENLHIDFIQKGQDLAFPELFQQGEEGIESSGSNRRLLHSAVERWLKPRAAAVKQLVLSFSARDQTHSFPKGGHGLRPIFRLLAPTLQELCIAHCSDIFHAKSFADVAMLRNLETLTVTFMAGRVSAADLAPLEQLRRLRALTLSASRQAEEGGQGTCLQGFPDTLLKLKGLQSLAVSSQGIASLPVGITKLKQLQCLDVSGCALSFLPSQMWKLGQLRHLRLNGTNLIVGLRHTWEPLEKMPSLESLEMRDTKSMFLPGSLSGLTSLTSLDLSDNPLEHVHTTGAGEESGLRSLACIPNLQRLLLRCCQLPSVPADLCNLSCLTHLDLSRNQLVELPGELSELQELQELVAEGNCFPRIPPVLFEMPKLVSADLSFNIYMEAAVSLLPQLEDGIGGFYSLRRLDLRKMLGVWKQSSIKWLQELVEELKGRHLELCGTTDKMPVVLWD